MGANAKKYGDYHHTKEWGRKARKAEAANKKGTCEAIALREEEAAEAEATDPTEPVEA